jgi:hypothetical protein
VDLAEKYTVSIYVTIDSTFPNETNVMGNRSAQLRVATVAQQSFHVAERERDLQLKRTTFYIEPYLSDIGNRFHAASFLCV